MDSVLRKQFSGKGFRKTETNVFEIRRDFEFCPRGGRVWEGIRAGFFFFWRALRKKIHNIEISAKPRYEICIVLDPPFLQKLSTHWTFISPCSQNPQ
jgi:hypothetical protein